MKILNSSKEKKTEPEVTQDKKVNKPVGSDPLQVFVDGKQVKFDVKPFATNNRTLVPMRAIFEALGAEVTWDHTTKTAIAKKDRIVVKVQIGKAEGTIEKNGAKEVKQLDGSSSLPIYSVHAPNECMIMSGFKKRNSKGRATSVPDRRAHV